MQNRLSSAKNNIMSQFILFPELVGSDSYVPMDGRLGLEKIEAHGRERGHALNEVFSKGVTKFEIHSGTLKRSTVQKIITL